MLGISAGKSTVTLINKNHSKKKNVKNIAQINKLTKIWILTQKSAQLW